MKMSMLRIAVDAMGGDLAPGAIVEGAIAALNEHPELMLILLGKEDAVRAELKKYKYDESHVQVVHCSEVIGMAEPPVNAISKKKDSSIVRGLTMVRKGEADSFISAGSTGAILVGGQVIVGRLKGVDRPPLGALIPTEKGFSLLIDCGANMDARPEWLVQFAQMGTVYMKHAMKIADPTVGIVNVGAEEEKGNALVKETFPLLRACPEIHFIGSVEARDIPAGAADVIVTDAFSGNLIMKMYEGVAGTLLKVIKGTLKSSVPGMLGGALIKKPLKSALKDFDASRYGGAPLLGLKGLVVKAHGSSKAVEIKNAVAQCALFYEEDVNGKIKLLMEEQAEKQRMAKKAAKEAQGSKEQS